MIVLDAGALVELVLSTTTGEVVAERAERDGEPVLVDVADAEVFSALARLRRQAHIGRDRHEQAVSDARDVPATRLPAALLTSDALPLLPALSPFDGLHAAAADALDAPLLTTDAPLARTVRDQLAIRVEVLEPALAGRDALPPPLSALPSRQRRAVLALRRAVHRTCSGRGALVALGSLAAGTADAVSDVDAALLVDDGAFDDVWARRGELPGAHALAAWDERDRDDPDRAVGVRRWLTADAVLVELLVAEAGAGVRFGEPLVLLAGDAELLEGVERGGTVRSEATVAPDADPEVASDRLKATVRAWQQR